MIPIKSESAWKGTADCRNCSIRDLVLFSSLSEEDFDHIHAPVDRLEFPIGTRLFQEGAHAVGAFTLRSGMVKLVILFLKMRYIIKNLFHILEMTGIE